MFQAFFPVVHKLEYATAIEVNFCILQPHTLGLLDALSFL
jgi:hypothetical protein